MLSIRMKQKIGQEKEQKSYGEGEPASTEKAMLTEGISEYRDSYRSLIEDKKDLSKIGIHRDKKGSVSEGVSYDAKFDGVLDDPETPYRLLARLAVMCEVLKPTNIETAADIVSFLNNQTKAAGFENITDWEHAILRCTFTIDTPSDDVQKADASKQADFEKRAERFNKDIKSPDALDKAVEQSDLEKKREDAKGTEKKEMPSVGGGDVKKQPDAEAVLVGDKLGITNFPERLREFKEALSHIPDELERAQITNELTWGNQAAYDRITRELFGSNRNLLTLLEPKIKPLKNRVQTILHEVQGIGLSIQHLPLDQENIASAKSAHILNTVKKSGLDSLNQHIAAIMDSAFGGDAEIPLPPFYRTAQGIEDTLQHIFAKKREENGNKGWEFNKKAIAEEPPVSFKHMEEKGIVHTNLTKQAEEGEFNDIVVNDDIIDPLLACLAKRGQKSGVLIGEAGSGKTSAVEALAKVLNTDKKAIPDNIAGYQIISISAGALGGNEYRQSEDTFVDAILLDCAKKPVILFIDEMHDIFKFPQALTETSLEERGFNHYWGINC